MKTRTWGDTVGVIGLIFAIISSVFGVFSLDPFYGFLFFWIAFISGFIGLGGGIAGTIGAASKNKCISAIVLSSLAINFAFFYFCISTMRIP